MLRKIRIVVSVLFFSLITLYFVDFAGLLPAGFSLLAQIQFLPALLALNLVVLAALVALTFIFGRVYCSSICPLGTFQDIVNWARRKFLKKKRFKYKKAANILRWSVLTITIIAFISGFSFLIGLLDPYSAFGRISVHVLKPAYLAGNNLLEAIFTHFGDHTFYRMSIYTGSVFSLIVALITLIVVGIMAWTGGRNYCNTICPVGTSLGLISKYSLFQIRIDENLCNSCGACGRNCKASCIDTKNHKIDASRCINCFDCIDVCNQSAMKFTYSMKTAKKQTIPDTSRRRFMLAVATTSLAAGKVLADKTIPGHNSIKTERKKAITPPGALNSKHFLTQCTSCHLCVSSCPSEVIKPAFLEYGLGGIMQPMMSFEKGFCNYDCTVCTDVCPSNALISLTMEEKHHNQMGQVQLVLENCIVVTDGTSCGACSEHCPTQAVSMIPYKDGLTIPHIEVDICVGCGGCEYICPAVPFKAIYVEGIDKHKRIELVKEEVEKIEVDGFGF
ncbi:MAG: 4Fe-4S binding protein [Paludibacteraceae bacterium]|nr:4Fe-4S binding protein [Paludibacteraceae bacterium]